MSDLAEKLRTLAFKLERETSGLSKPRTNDLLDLANAAEVMEGNLVYLTSCMAASANEIAERKSSPSSQVTRHYNLMEVCARALAGIPVWKMSSTRAVSLARVERTRAEIADRLRRRQRRPS